MESNNNMLALVGIFFYGLIICFIFGSTEIYTYFAPDLVVNLSKEEAKSFCGDSSLAGKYGLFIDKGSYLKRQKNLTCVVDFLIQKR